MFRGTTYSNWSPQERELYASIHCIKKWHNYIGWGSKDKPTRIISDHRTLATFRTHKWDCTTNARRARWAEFLESYHIVQEYREGISPELATPDAISRCLDMDPETAAKVPDFCDDFHMEMNILVEDWMGPVHNITEHFHISFGDTEIQPSVYAAIVKEVEDTMIAEAGQSTSSADTNAMSGLAKIVPDWQDLVREGYKGDTRFNAIDRVSIYSSSRRGGKIE